MLDVRVMRRSDWDVHLCHCQALQVMDMKVHTGEISPYLKPNRTSPLMLSFFSQYINNIITHTEPEIKSTRCTRPHPERIIQPSLWILCLWPWYSWDSQAATCRISPLINSRTGCFDASRPHQFTHISLPLTSADRPQSPESSHTEAEEKPKLARFRKTARTTALVLTLEQSKIMIRIVPVTSAGTWTLANQDMLICMHSPLGEEAS